MTGSGSYLKQLQILHGAFCAGVVLFAGIDILLVHTNGGPFGLDAELVQPLTIAAIVVAVAGLVGNILLPNRLIEKARAAEDVRAKLGGYRGAFILGVALLEGPALFSIMLYLLCGNPILLLITAVLIGRMLMMRPSREKIVEALGLQYDEANAVDEAT